MLNIILELDDRRLDPVMDCFGPNARNYVIPKEGAEAVIVRILRELAVKKHQPSARIILTATRCGETRFFDHREICYFESFRNRVCIYGIRDSFEFYGKLYQVEEVTRGLDFCRINNSYIVSLMHIRMIRGGYVVLNSGKEISIGRKYGARLREAVRKGNFLHLCNP